MYTRAAEVGRRPGDVVRSASLVGWTVRTQRQSVGHAALESIAANWAQFASRRPVGAAQQQYHGVVPQVRPSHRQTAPAGAVKTEATTRKRTSIRAVIACRISTHIMTQSMPIRSLYKETRQIARNGTGE
jgi:hypothetical protein